MKLTVLERLTLLQVLPAEGNFLTLKIVRTVTNSLALNDKEFKEFNLNQDGDQITWNAKGNEEREVEIGEKATDIIIESFKKLDKEKKLEQRHFSLYEKFVEKQPEKDG